MQHLILIHIGPVQEFIAAARRTRDLWFGSWLISELSKAAARSIAEQSGEDSLVFPAAPAYNLGPGTDLAVANKIVALVEDPKNVAEKAKSAVEARLTELGQIALVGLEDKLETWATALAQIADLPEFYWVAVPMPDESKYPHVRDEAENLLAARKNCRDFSQPEWDDRQGKPKSSLDGKRESVIPESAYPAHDDSQAKRENKIAALYDDFRARSAERLSGVDLLKRLGKRNKGDKLEPFPSTSHMAALPLWSQLNEKVSPDMWKRYWNRLPKAAREQERIHFTPLLLPNLDKADGSLLFTTRLIDYFDQPGNGLRGQSSKLIDAQRALDKFYEDTGLDRPNPYYAILAGDGDFVGRTINEQKTPAAHRQFSQTLAGFAEQVNKTVAKHRGAVVYAGGDDVLVLLSLDTMLQCAAELAATFQNMMREKGYEATFSAGIAIFHHTEPLEDALQTARRAEKEAKSLPGKNALAVIEAKRSGAPRLVKGKWGELDRRLLAVAAFYQQEMLPYGLAYQLRDMALHLGGETAVAANPNLRDIVKAEAGRIIKRKEGGDEAQNYVENQMAGRLDKSYTMPQLVNELIIAHTIAQATKQSGNELPLPSQKEE